MLLNEDEIKETMESPLNLLNRLKTSLNKHSHNIIPSLPPKASEIIDDLDDRLKNNSTRSKAVSILNAAMDELKIRIPEVQRPEKLAQIAAEMSRVVSHQDSKGNEGKLQSQIIIYAPQMQKIENYDIIEVAE